MTEPSVISLGNAPELTKAFRVITGKEKADELGMGYYEKVVSDAMIAALAKMRKDSDNG
jgi:hypothetical protein